MLILHLSLVDVLKYRQIGCLNLTFLTKGMAVKTTEGTRASRQVYLNLLLLAENQTISDIFRCILESNLNRDS